MPTYIAVINQKGGVGKTTTSGNLCGALCKLGYKTLAVDADSQQSLSDWMQMSDPPSFPFAVLTMTHSKLHVKLPEIVDASGFDFVVIDCPPGGQTRDQRDDVSRSATLLADMVLIPLLPKPADFLAVRRLQALLAELCRKKPDLIVAIAINMKKAGEKMSRMARQEAFDLMNDEDIHLTILESEIAERSIIAGAIGFGATVFDHKSKVSSEKEALAKASTEYLELAKEIITCLRIHSVDSTAVHA
jgi:chromosome partitioning protein